MWHHLTVTLPHSAQVASGVWHPSSDNMYFNVSRSERVQCVCWPKCMARAANTCTGPAAVQMGYVPAGLEPRIGSLTLVESGGGFLSQAAVAQQGK